MLSVNVLYEYIDLAERFQQLEQTVQTSLDLAIDSSVASEELFSSNFQDKMVSSYGTDSSASSLVSSTLLLYRDGRWISGNSYVFSAFYNENGRFPETLSEYNSVWGSQVNIADIYEYLYGDVGEDYTNSSLAWANRSQSTKNLYSSIATDMSFTHATPSARKPNSVGYNAAGLTSLDDFEQFYDSIGYKMTTTSTVRVKNGDRFDITQETFPTLAQMGLKLDTFNSTTSSITADNFQSSYKIGKASVGKAKTVYYLTPYSLGVTYVPVSILKPMFLANLETQVRLNKLSSSNPKDVDEAYAILDEADGCVSTKVYTSGDDTAPHQPESNELIVNDGLIEYDLNSAQVKVDYFFVDFYDTTNADIVGRIEGCMSGYNSDGTRKGISQSVLLENTVNNLKDSDTSSDYYNSKGQHGVTSGHRLVARVSCKIKVHVLYQSSIIQWAQYKFGDAKHFDIRSWDSANGKMSTTADGTWFQYTTYYAVTR